MPRQPANIDRVRMEAIVKQRANGETWREIGVSFGISGPRARQIWLHHRQIDRHEHTELDAQAEAFDAHRYGGSDAD
jgi:hypothetical protein